MCWITYSKVLILTQGIISGDFRFQHIMKRLRIGTGGYITFSAKRLDSFPLILEHSVYAWDWTNMEDGQRGLLKHDLDC
ncbi:unnamed protein product [Arabidopsis lyrata]|nr:unnamed protein product [Arabidopsis lyrata]